MIAAVEGGLSRRAAADRLQVAASAAVKWVPPDSPDLNPFELAFAKPGTPGRHRRRTPNLHTRDCAHDFTACGYEPD